MKHKALVATVLLAALSGFAKTFDVDVSTGRPAASNEAYYHGETIEFRAVRGRSVVTNIEYASIYYQTNGMGDVWWRTDGLVFHPTNDVGAASYRFFMEGRETVGSGGVESGGVDSPTPSLTHSPTISRDWHANGLLRLLPSPGFTPNTIELPVARLDFAAVEVLNPPWTDPDYSTNNTELVETIEATAPAPGNYTAVSNAAMNALSRAEAEAGFTEWVCEPAIERGQPFSVVYRGRREQLDWWALYLGDRLIEDNFRSEINPTELLFDDTFPVTATRTRLPTMADIPTAQINAATTTNALQDTALESHASQLSQLSQSLDGKADREIVIGQMKGLPGDCFPIAYVYNGDSYSIVNSGGIVVDQFGPAYYRLADSVTGVLVCHFRISDGTYFSNGEASGITFGGTAPTQLAWPVLGDVPKKSSVVYDVDIKMNYYDKAETEAKIVGKQDNLPYPTNAIPYAAISGKPSLATVATSGSYNDLSNKPTIPTVPTAQINAATATNALQDTAIESNRVSIASHADSISTLGDSISTLSNTTSTVYSGLAQLADEVAPAVNGYARLYSFVTGSTNANFVVTNYQLTAEAEASRTHFDPSDPDLDFSTVPPSLRLEDASSGTNRVVVDTRDWTVWYYAQKIGGAMAEAVSTAVDTCRAWCGFTATGLENPAPDTLVVDVPNIWLMAGKTFEKHIAGSNAVWIIRSSGVVMPISDNSQSAGGFLELTDAFGTPYIRFKKTGSYFVDPAADGVEYDSATGAWLVTYTTTTCPKGGANAVLEGSTTYPGKAILKDEDDPDCPATITWTGSANNWVMHAVPKQIDGAVPSKMFFAAVVEVQGQDYIEYLRPMSVPSLMFNGTTYTSTVSGNELKFIATQP